MATQIDTSGRVFTLGNVFNRAFGVMGGAAATVFGVSFLLYAVPQAIWSYILPTFMVGVTPVNFAAFWGLTLVGGLIMTALYLIVQGTLVRAVVASGEGRPASLAECLDRGIRMALPLLGLSILAWLGIMAGMTLLLVPGIILGIMWSVAAPALVDEQTGIIAAFGRSRYLTKGARWKIFGLVLLLLVIMWIAVMLLGVLLMALVGMSATQLAMAGRVPTALMTLLSLIFNTVLIGFWATMLTSLFVELRNWKEGLDPGNLSEVFS